MPRPTKMNLVLSRAALENDNVRDIQIVSPTEEPQYHEEFSVQEYDEDMTDDGSILGHSHPKKAASGPIIPQRSALRTSRIFEVAKIEPQPEQEDPVEEVKHEEVSDPHQLYLSSEEDASESADDYDESLLELDDEPTRSRSSSIDSQEDTARMISFMFVGKPILIEISIKKPKQKSRPVKPRPTALRLDSNSSFQLPSLKTPPLEQETIPDTVSSRVSVNTTDSDSETRSIVPSFLDTDPCAMPAFSETSIPRSPSNTIPKTPSSIANAAWKSVGRTLSTRRRPSKPSPDKAKDNEVRGSLDFGKAVREAESMSDKAPVMRENVQQDTIRARRRPSIPMLNFSDKSNALPEKKTDNEVRASVDSGKAVEKVEPVSPNAPVTYEDVMRGAVKTKAPVVKERQLKQKMSMFGLGRKKSVKLSA